MTATLTLQAALFEAFAAVLLYATFCRLSKMDAKKTLLRARLAYYALAVVTAACLFGVPFWGFKVDWFDTALVGAYMVVQLVSSKSWLNGVPIALTTDHGQLDEVHHAAESAK